MPTLRPTPLLPLVAAVAILTTAHPATAQQIPGLEVPEDTTVVQVVRLADGSVLYGRIEDLGPPVRLRLRDGQIFSLAPASIRSVEILEGRVVDGEVWEADSNPTRLFFAPTARTTPAGSGYFAVYELVVPFLSFSITDRFMVAGGTPLIGAFDGDRPFWIAPKLQLVRRERFQLATGAWFIASGSSNELLSLLFGVATWGSTDNAFTAGVGYGFEGSDVADEPALVGGFETRVSRRMKLVSENWYIPGGYGLVSLGPRFMGSRLSADVGLGYAFDGGDGVVVPLVNFVFSW